VAATAPEFRFDPPALVEAARRRWPDAKVTVPDGELAEHVAAYVDLPPPTERTPQLAFARSGEALDLDAPTREEAAEILAWLCESANLPTTGSVVVIHWLDDAVPLTPNLTAETLLAMQ
jgi:hypothetical protein